MKGGEDKVGGQKDIHTEDEKKKSSNLLIKFAELSVGVRVNATVKFTLYSQMISIIQVTLISQINCS